MKTHKKTIRVDFTGYDNRVDFTRYDIRVNFTRYDIRAGFFTGYDIRVVLRGMTFV